MEMEMGYGSRHMPILISDSPARPSSRVLLDFHLNELDLNVPLPGIYEFFGGVGYNYIHGDAHAVAVADTESDEVLEVIDVDSSSETNTPSLPPSQDSVVYNYQLQPGPSYAFPDPDPNLYMLYYQLLQANARPSHIAAAAAAYHYANWYLMQFQGQQGISSICCNTIIFFANPLWL